MRTLLAALLVLALAPAAATAATVSDSSGDVRAVLDYKRDKDGPFYVANKLTITRDGETAFEGKPEPKPCEPLGCTPTVDFGEAIPPLRVVDLTGDGEPEVIYQGYTGGAHCCFVAEIFELVPSENLYAITDHFFGDAGYRLRRSKLGDGLDFFSSDWRFEGAFAPTAFSSEPVRILSYSNTGMTDVTRAYKGRVRKDARIWWKVYKERRGEGDGTQLGAAAAWAADRYLLGKRKQALRLLRRQARMGHLRGPDRTQGLRFVRKLDRFLKRLDYA